MLNLVEDPGRLLDEQVEDDDGLDDEELEGRDTEEVAETTELPLRGRGGVEATLRPRPLTPQREGGRR